jgi:hypothetical protein
MKGTNCQYRDYTGGWHRRQTLEIIRVSLSFGLSENLLLQYTKKDAQMG